jgi:hypothetical protein
MTQVLDAPDVTRFSAPSPTAFPARPDLSLALAALPGGIHYRVPLRESRWTWHRSETGFTASDLVTGIFGFGSDLNEAIRDLLHALRDHREVLERQEALSPDLERQLKYLRQLR